MKKSLKLPIIRRCTVCRKLFRCMVLVNGTCMCHGCYDLRYSTEDIKSPHRC